MRNRRSKHYVFLLCVLALVCLLIGKASGQSARMKKTQAQRAGDIRLEVLSVREYTTVEKEKFVDSIGSSLAVRLRFSNDSNSHISFISPVVVLQPVGYRLYRAVGESEWRYRSATRNRDGGPGTEFSDNPSYRWLVLAPRSAVEFEVDDFTTQTEEHAFSILFTYFDERPIREVVSNPYRPLPASPKR
jgi:hypothetical protein